MHNARSQAKPYWGDIPISERYRETQHFKDSPEHSKRPKFVLLHHDTVTFQDIWVDPAGWAFLVSPEYPGLQAMIVPPFKINGKSYYRKLLKNYELPNWIIPDSALLVVTWWCRDSNEFCWQSTDDITVLKGDHSDFRRSFHRPTNAVIHKDTGTFKGFYPESIKYTPTLRVSIHDSSESGFSLAPPFLIDGEPSYRLIAQGAEDLPGLADALRKDAPCTLCPPSLVPDSTILEVTSWSRPKYPDLHIVDAVRILGRK
ncbi:MAG: hypothetical protein Q8922_04305 [Bacteroidota bacterium]|nr:hypothetical protein [Bacteroidota bacterium]MDP4231802.1 hypothetical protein [Bacteroidota bacterium]MDP4242688.1 hypothetical protein [Bacteroidota bacterium]MDP4287139.1 hypothetical protein [Bacteroidota bacterium]